MPPLWLCDWVNCQYPAVQRAGDCVLCDRHLCRTHLRDQWHACPKPETNWSEYSARYVAAESRRLEELCRRIDGGKLCERASQVRSDANVPCAIDLSPKKLSAMMGGQNCHAEVVFADGVVWLARFRVPSPISPPVDVRDYVLRSEAATMEFLQRHTRVPSPRVFDWACESDPANAVGVGYILMEKLQGTPLDWQGATTAQREKVVRQLADIMLEIERHPFDRLGSLVAPAVAATVPQIQVQSLAQHSTFQSGEDDGPLGPFCSSREASRALVEAHLRMIAGGEIGTAENAADVFLAHRFRLDVLDRVWKATTAAVGEEDEKFFLKHADDKGDHIFVNADFDIVGVIDWEWCSTVSKEEAFSSPCMMWPVAAFYDGSNELADEELLLARVFCERGREDLARCVLDGRTVQRFLFALGPGGASHENRRTFACLFMGLKRAFDPEQHGGTEEERGREEEEWEVWKAGALVKWKHDGLLQAILKSK
ncbi:hypothetical protein JDV02_004418 [Purpureocillium takamizusanense]|uniref:Aminoglycoside phosphotransferase domain-containing protein n=1 Tax=Purpureocillium takamizusanense TaxID=2060973 RepID=A0A9Q8QDT0_9HYPO|nr:uncharacterized protein JDV02_004418 [Purpureocillium takamizusanense]UNI18128.1 hypothetical protein JDV02_004418 [Purpureocillium takamizusanense]